MTLERVDDTGITDAGSLLRRVAALHGDREALVDGAERMTFRAWDARADAAAALLAAYGVAQGDVVCLVLPSCTAYAVCYQAAMRLGAITSGINPRLGPREVASILERTKPRVTVVDPSAAALAGAGPAGDVLERATVESAPDARVAPVTFPFDTDVAIVWTSGTTGIPKGAVFDHGCLRAMVDSAGALSAPGDRRLSPLPFAHLGAMTRVWDELVHVITTVILPTPWKAADHLRLIEEERITVGQGVPTQWQLVLALPGLDAADTSSLRITSTGAARVPADLVREMKKRFNAPVVVRYTSTEACVSTGTQVDDPDDVVATTVGRPGPGVEMRIDAPHDGVGEVCFRSRARMRRYWKDPERTADVIDAEGWVHTGDLGYLDPAGNLVLAGRRIEMFTRGGYNVYPAEVENTLGEHPLVGRVAVVGMPDPVLGSVGVAAVVPADPAHPPTLEDLRQFCIQRISNYKAPDRLVVVQDLPVTSMLKVDKAALAATLL